MGKNLLDCAAATGDNSRRSALARGAGQSGHSGHQHVFAVVGGMGMRDYPHFALRGLAAAATLVVSSSVTPAAVNSFNDRTSFNAAAGAGQLAENFSGFVADTVFRTAPVA